MSLNVSHQSGKLQAIEDHVSIALDKGSFGSVGTFFFHNSACFQTVHAGAGGQE
jgi:hypothetical protein